LTLLKFIPTGLVVAVLAVAAFWLIQRRRRAGGVIVDSSVSPGNPPQEGL